VKRGETGILLALYAPSKSGKTLATLCAAFHGKWVAEKGALLPANEFGIPIPDAVRAPELPDVAKYVSTLVKQKTVIPALVIDDMSLIVQRTLSRLENEGVGVAMWGRIRQWVMSIAYDAKELTERGTHVIFNFHEQPPRTSSGKYIRGGPQMPGQLPEQFSAECYVVCRAVFDPTAAPWKYVLHTGPSGTHIHGDRMGVFPDVGPMNLREGLIQAGYDIPRPKGMEWMDSVVEKMSEKLLADDNLENWKQVLKAPAVKLAQKHGSGPVRWAVQDTVHRAVIKHHLAEGALMSLFEDGGEDDW